jgi:hypothetical protein
VRFTFYITARAAAVTGVICLAASSCGWPGTAHSSNGNCSTTAAEALGWGAPNRADDFNDPSSLAGWDLYDGPGHEGNGRRTPHAISIADGVLTIMGYANGDSGGMAWMPGQLYGRWEVCVKSSPAPESYHSVLLLWPDAEDWPWGGEVDFMEIKDPARQFAESWVIYGPGDQKVNTATQIDATQWHSFAVEWTPLRVAIFVDGAERWEMTNPAHVPPRRMHLCMQLDYFGGDTGQGATEMVDWASQYPLT